MIENRSHRRFYSNSRTFSHMSLRYLIFALMVVFLCSACASSGPKRKSPTIKIKSTDQTMLDLRRRLNLKKEQEEKIRPIIANYLKQKRTIVKDNSSSDSRNKMNMYRELTRLDHETDLILAKFFTSTQMALYKHYQESESLKKMEAMQKENGGGKMGGGVGRGGGRGRRGGSWGGGF
jgi:hypothetical protein